MKDVWIVLVERLKSPIIINLSTRQRPKKSGVAVTVHSDSHTAFGKDCSTALAARSRHGREHAVNAVALIEEYPRDGNSAVSGGHMTDRPKSDGVTAEQTCPARRVRMSAVSVAKAVCRVPGPWGVWWGRPSTEVRPLSLAFPSPRGKVKAVWPPP